MKYVIDAVNLKVIQVPDDYIECSVCHKWMPKSSYCDERGIQVRTNCEECYQLKHDDLVELQKKYHDFISINWRCGKMRTLEKECSALEYSITKEELIARFNEAMAKIPDGAKICTVEYINDDCDNIIEDYMSPYFDPTLEFDGKVWMI